MILLYASSLSLSLLHCTNNLWQEFGTDIVGEDNKTIILHVVTSIACFLHIEGRTARNIQRLSATAPPAKRRQGTGALGGTVAHKRPMLQPQQSSNVSIMGGMSAGARQPGSRNGLAFNHILQRPSGELQKSRETSAELGAVVGTMGEIENIMGEGHHPNLPSYSHVLPPVRPPFQHQQQQPSQLSQPSSEQGPSSALLQSPQSQLSETQSTLHSREEKVRSLEALLSEHDNIECDVSRLQDFIEEQRERQCMTQHMCDEDEDKGDSWSVCTVVPRVLETVQEEDETSKRARRGAPGGKNLEGRTCPSHPPSACVTTTSSPAGEARLLLLRLRRLASLRRRAGG